MLRKLTLNSVLRLRRVGVVTTPTISKRLNHLGTFKLPTVKNEQFLNYAPGSPERAALRAALEVSLTYMTQSL